MARKLECRHCGTFNTAGTPCRCGGPKPMSSMISELNDWIYIYYIKDGKLFYDRTVSRHGLGPSRAKQLVEEHEKRGLESYYTIGNLSKTEAFS